MRVESAASATFRLMKREAAGRVRRVGSILIVAGALCGLASTLPAMNASPAGESGPILLDQGWSPDDRAAYHRTSQGSAVMPYELFLALEQAGGTGLF